MPDNILLEKLKEIIPFKFRLGNWVGKYQTVNNRKVYDKYSVLGYIDSRDAQDRLDEVIWFDWEDQYMEIKWRLYCGVTIKWKTRWDCGTESNTEQEKGEASDAFKRACVKRGLGRFLYTLPNMYITKDEAQKNKYNITEFVKTKFKSQLTEWHNNYKNS